MNMQLKQSQQGFSLVELVIVIIILGLLAVTALPRLIDATDDAEDATVEGVAGGFATGVGLVRAQWELQGRPDDGDDGTDDNVASVTMGTTVIGVDENIGYPTGAGSDGDANSAAANINAADCVQIFTRILQSAPSIDDDHGDAVDDGAKYYAQANNDICRYYLMATVKNNEPGADEEIGNGFLYDAASGQVTVFLEN
jgi:MSHA pilin protein MshB